MEGYKSAVEELYNVLDSTTEIITEKLNISYLEGLVLSGENLFQEEILQQLDDITHLKLKKLYDTIALQQMSAEETRKAIQLAILKGMKEATQPNHEMTADAVSLFVGYILDMLTKKKEAYTLLDPAIGTGNLVTAIMNQSSKPVQAFGVEVDETLLNLSYMNANLQKHSIELYRQDSLQPLFINPVDAVVCDLPVGYYPNDEAAKQFELREKEGYSFSHYLFIEKSILHAAPGGFIVLLIPNTLFEGESSKKLHSFIKETSVVHGLLQLPKTMFKKEKHAKSIFILQKKGEHVTTPKQALLAELPRFTNKEAMQDMLQRIKSWIDSEVHKE